MKETSAAYGLISAHFIKYFSIHMHTSNLFKRTIVYVFIFLNGFMFFFFLKIDTSRFSGQKNEVKSVAKSIYRLNFEKELLD